MDEVEDGRVVGAQEGRHARGDGRRGACLHDVARIVRLEEHRVDDVYKPIGGLVNLHNVCRGRVAQTNGLEPETLRAQVAIVVGALLAGNRVQRRRVHKLVESVREGGCCWLRLRRAERG